MSILVKGMEMPKDGNETIVRIQPDGTILDQYGHHLAITAIPVPPHGDLVERNIILHKMRLRKWMVGRDSDPVNIVEDAPTVIPAEEDET